MHYPLISPHLLKKLRLIHGAYNGIMMLLVFYHGWLGIIIRRNRKVKAPLPFPIIKRHRKGGPILTLFGVLGFFIGLTLVFLDTGNILEFPLHLFTGLALIILLIFTYALSHKIKGPDSVYRTPHFAIGLIILWLYLIEVLLGLRVLL